MNGRAATASPLAPTIVNVGYRSTNYWVVSAASSRILVDLGWPGSMGEMRAALKRMDVPLHEIKYGLATHYHMDHAGLAQELKLAGVPLLVIDLQVEWISRMKQHVKAADRFTDITLNDNVVISCGESRALLAAVGIVGEIVHTPGHSDDHVSLVLDNGAAFTGDLGPMALAGEDAHIARASWQLLIDKGATTAYPGHGRIGRL